MSVDLPIVVKRSLLRSAECTKVNAQSLTEKNMGAVGDMSSQPMKKATKVNQRKSITLKAT